MDAAGLVADLDAGGVHGAVVVQPHGAYAYDNRYVAEARVGGARPPGGRVHRGHGGA